jgi:hypothetical protein
MDEETALAGIRLQFGWVGHGRGSGNGSLEELYEGCVHNKKEIAESKKQNADRNFLCDLDCKDSNYIIKEQPASWIKNRNTSSGLLPLEGFSVQRCHLAVILLPLECISVQRRH